MCTGRVEQRLGRAEGGRSGRRSGSARAGRNHRAVLLYDYGAAVVLPVAGREVGDLIGLGSMFVTVGIASRPVLLLVVSFMMKPPDRPCPNVRQPGFPWVTPGGLFAVLLWLAARPCRAPTWRTSPYNKTYGSLGGVIVFLTWPWIMNIIVLLCAELNVQMERSRRYRGYEPHKSRTSCCATSRSRPAAKVSGEPIRKLPRPRRTSGRGPTAGPITTRAVRARRRVTDQRVWAADASSRASAGPHGRRAQALQREDRRAGSGRRPASRVRTKFVIAVTAQRAGMTSAAPSRNSDYRAVAASATIQPSGGPPEKSIACGGRSRTASSMVAGPSSTRRITPSDPAGALVGGARVRHLPAYR